MLAKETPGSKIGRPKTFNRDHVVGVAMDYYWREGVDSASLNELCRRAEVSKPGLYREFGGEDGLMDAALKHYAETVLSSTAAMIAQNRPFRETLTILIEMMTNSQRTWPSGCLLVKMQMSPSRLGLATRARVDALRVGARAVYADWFDRAKQRGEVAPSIPTQVAASFLETQSTMLLVQMGLGENPELIRAQARLAFAGLCGTALAV